MEILAERTFTLADQGRFAALSGDFNPVHVDEVAARRTLFGAPVVHGVHLVCWALEIWLGRCPPLGAIAIESLAANFMRGALVGETLRVVSLTDGEQEFGLRIQRDRTELTSIRGKFGATVTYPDRLPPLESIECRAMSAADIPEATGRLPLAYSAPDMDQLFPRLSAALPPFQLAALLTSTRLVGMECPGLHSIYSALDLSFARKASGPPELNYRISYARQGALFLEVDGPGFSGELEASVRPAPKRQALVGQLAHLVERNEFFGQTSVVIGGSRGLGEVAAKLLALGGADVTITYRLGQEDAEAIAAEIRAAGGKCKVAQFDSNRPTQITLPQSPTHLYYFATPHIAVDRTVVFSAERFGEYCRCYVTNFVRTLLEIVQSAPTLDVFYPSTIFLDEPTAHMAEYCAAKAAGEELCRQLEIRFPGWRMHSPRLPRMLTDQNNGLVPAETEKPELVILRCLREMKPKAS